MSSELRIRRVYLRNIAPFREAEFEIPEGLVLVCGPNGAGKTVLCVDAPLAALTGRAANIERVTSLSQLILQDSTEGVIEVDVEVGGSLFRVRRVLHSRGPQEAYLFKLEKGLERLITQGAKEVDKKVRELLGGLGYNLLLAGPFVRQGDLHDFLRRDPKGRREILMSLYGINLDEAARKAREKQRQCEGEEKELGRQVRELEDIVRRRESRERLLRDTEEQIAQAERKLETLKSEFEEASNLASQTTILRSEEERYQEELEELFKKAQRLQREIEDASKELEKAQQGSQEVRRLDTIRELLEELGSTHADLEKRRKRLGEWKRRLEDLLKLHREKDELEKRVRDREAVDRERAALLDRLKEVQKKRAAAEQRYESVERVMELLRRGVKAECPFCKRPLEPGDLERLQREHTREYTALQTEIERTAEEERRLTERINDLQRLLQELSLALGRLEKVREQIHALEAEEGSADALQSRIESEEEAIEQLNRRMQELHKELRNLGWKPPSNLEEVEKSLSEVRNEIAEYQHLASSLPSVEDKLKRSRAELEDTKRQIERKERRLEEIREQLRKAEEAAKKAERLKKEIESLERRVSELRELRGRVLRELAEIEEAEKKRRELDEKLKELGKKKNLYYAIAQIFDSKHLPMYMLHEVVQRLSDLANYWLGELTNGQMSVYLNVTRDEGISVDVRVIRGTQEQKRTIKNLSGGERALVGFALRLALVQALLERGGYSVPDFMIIDEGLAPLDGDNLNLVLEAISRLMQAERPPFRSVVLISHREEAAAHVPQCLRVIRDASGCSRLIWETEAEVG